MKVNVTYHFEVVVVYNYKFPRVLLSFLNCAFLGRLSSADWNVRRRGGGGSMATANDAAVPLHNTPSSGITLRGRLGKVLENRDLCRMVTTYIPNDDELER